MAPPGPMGKYGPYLMSECQRRLHLQPHFYSEISLNTYDIKYKGLYTRWIGFLPVYSPLPYTAR
jgi:hypothetical protein